MTPFRRHRDPRRNVPAFAIALACLVALGGCQKEKTGDALPESAEQVAAGREVTPPQPAAATEDSPSRTTDGTRWYPASTEAVRTSTLTAEVAGLVKGLEVEEGEVVEADQLIAEIDVRQYQLQSRQARSGVKAAEVQRDAVKKEWERFKNLAESGAVPRAEFDRIDSQLAQAEAAIAQAKAGQQVARHAAGESKVVAPFRGMISKRHAAEGSMASPGVPIVELVEIDTLLVRGQIPAELFAKVGVGDVWRLRLPALELESEVTIARVLPFVNPTTRRFEVLAHLDNPDHRFATGLFAELAPKTLPLAATPSEAEDESEGALDEDPPAGSGDDDGKPAPESPADEAAPSVKPGAKAARTKEAKR